MDLDTAKERVSELAVILSRPFFEKPNGPLPQCVVDRSPEFIEDRLFVDEESMILVKKAEFFYKPDDAAGEEVDWPDLRDDVLLEVSNRVYRQITEHIFSTSQKLEAIKVRKNLLPSLHDELDWDTKHIQSIVGKDTHIWESFSQDVSLMMNSLLLENGPHPLGVLLMSVYRAGGLPCGWYGDYPDGYIVVFWPYDEDPVIQS